MFIYVTNIKTDSGAHFFNIESYPMKDKSIQHMTLLYQFCHVARTLHRNLIIHSRFW